MLITEGKGIAVDLQFTHHGQGWRWLARARFTVEHPQQPGVPGPQFVCVEGVIEAEQANAVAHTLKALSWSPANALGGAVWGHEGRIR